MQTIASPNDDPIAEYFGAAASTYSRAQALADGVLIDVSDVACKAGFEIPVAITRAVYLDCVAWTVEDSKRQTYQEEDARLWDVLYMCQLSARRSGTTSDRFVFVFHRVPRGGNGRMPRVKRLKILIGPGDTSDPVATILDVNED